MLHFTLQTAQSWQQHIYPHCQLLLYRALCDLLHWQAVPACAGSPGMIQSTAHSSQSCPRHTCLPSNHPKSSGSCTCYKPSITSSHVAAWKTPLMMHCRLLGTKFFVSLKNSYSTPSPASLLQATHHSGAASEERDLWGVWFPAWLSCVHKPVFLAQHITSTLCSQPVKWQRESHCACKTAVPARARVQGSISCLLTHQQNYLLCCDFQSHGPSAVLSRTELSRTTGTAAVICGCWVSAQSQHRPQQGNRQLKLFRQGKNQVLQLKKKKSSKSWGM